jgi:hypothetical protein
MVLNSALVIASAINFAKAFITDVAGPVFRRKLRYSNDLHAVGQKRNLGC